jgi:hypothetical protein
LAGADESFVAERTACVRRARPIDRPSSIWFFPWQGEARQLAQVPLASGRLAVAPNGDVQISQTTSNDMDLAMLELKPML